MTLRRPTSDGDLLQVTFTNRFTNAQVTLTLTLESDFPVKLLSQTTIKEVKDVDDAMVKDLIKCVKRGVDKTGPSTPGHLWNVLLEIDLCYPRLMKDIKYTMGPSSFDPKRIY